jgi:H/ACA ribonucleoprotein complex subunit 4
MLTVKYMKLDIEKIKSEKTIQELLEFGIINIDKSSGPTSFSVSEFVCKRLGLRKTSHFGTLDPKVTGVLPVALNRACKLTGFFLGEDKTYVGVMRLHDKISVKELQEIINKKFLGKIMQKPPVKSRVKRVEREREIISFEILEQNESNSGKDFLFKTKVQGGTYIRKLIDDLGKELGIGAHMLELRRVQAGIFSEEKIVNLYKFEEAISEYDNGKGSDKKLREMIIPGEIVSEVYEVVFVKEDSIDKLLHGSPLFYRYLENKNLKMENDKIVCVFSGEKFIGMYKVLNSNVEDTFAKPEFVLQPFEENEKGK